MFGNIMTFFKNMGKKEEKKQSQENSKDAAKERLHLVLMQDRANVSADFLELMKQEIIDVIKKYIEIDEKEIDVRLTNKENEDGTNGSPALYANIPILNIKNDARKVGKKEIEKGKKDKKQEEKEETINKEEQKNEKKDEIKETQSKEKTEIENKTENKEEDKKEEKQEKRAQEIIEEIIEKIEEKEEKEEVKSEK